MADRVGIVREQRLIEVDTVEAFKAKLTELALGIEPRSSEGPFRMAIQRVFKLEGIDVPDGWSQVATDIIAQKYFRKAGVPQTDAEAPEGPRGRGAAGRNPRAPGRGAEKKGKPTTKTKK